MRFGRLRNRSSSESNWYAGADAWFKLLGAVALGYIILAQVVAIVRTFADVSAILAGGILVAYFVFPAVSWLNRRLPLWLAITLVYGVICVLAALALEYLLPTLSTQLQSLIAHLPAIRQAADAFFESPHNPLTSHLPAPLQTLVHGLPDRIAAQIEKNAAEYTTTAFTALFAVATFAAIAVAIPVVSVYMLAEAPVIKRFFVGLIPPARRQHAVGFLADVDAVIGGFIRGQIIVAVTVGCLAILALSILGVPYAYVIGAWAGLADVVPYIGPFAGAIPAAIVAITEKGWGSLAGVVIAFTVINQLEGHLLAPRIVGRTVKITPLAVIFALLICAHLFGFVGLIVAVPLAGLVRVALVHLLPQHEISNAELQPGLTHVPKRDVDPAATADDARAGRP